MGQLLDSVNESIGKMTWIKPADRAAVALAETYARQIDDVLDGPDAKCKECGADCGPDAAQITKALYLGPHLLNALRALGATPEGRAGLDVTEPVKGALSGIRNRRAAGQS